MRISLVQRASNNYKIVWAQNHLKVPVIDHWWQTETGWAIACNPVGIEQLPVKIGSPSVAMPGYDVRVLDEGGHEVAAGELGAIAVKLPLPPGTLPTLWNAEDRFRKSYLNHFPGFYETGDAGYIDEDVWNKGRGGRRGVPVGLAHSFVAEYLARRC